MAVLDRSEERSNRTDKQKIYTSTMLTVAILAVSIFSLLLVSSANQLSQSTGTVTGSIGPVRLFEVSKVALPVGGYSGGFRLLPLGILLFGVLALFTTAVVIAFRVRQHNH